MNLFRFLGLLVLHARGPLRSSQWKEKLGKIIVVAPEAVKQVLGTQVQQTKFNSMREHFVARGFVVSRDPRDPVPAYEATRQGRTLCDFILKNALDLRNGEVGD